MIQKVRTLSCFFYSILCWLTPIACVTSTQPPMANEPPIIIGTWSWTDSWVQGSHITPQTAGFTRQYRFIPDSNWYIYLNDSLIDSSQYKITRGVVSWIKDSVDIIHITAARGEFYPFWAASYIRRDSLILDDVGLDGGRHIYGRIR